jgi:uncharacterized membrane protein
MYFWTVPLTLLLSASNAIAIPFYWVLAIVAVAAVGFVAFLNWLLNRVFSGNWLRFMLWLMVAGTIVGAIGIGLDALL